MKVSTLLAGIALVAVASAESDSNYSYYEDDYDYTFISNKYEEDEEILGWYVPMENGSFYWYPREEWNNTFEPYMSGSARFFLYTKLNPNKPTRLYPDDVDSIYNSNFDISNPTRFLIHGYLNDKSSDFNVVVRKALVKVDASNVIVVDWSSMSSLFYPFARSAVPHAGAKIAKFIDFLHTEIGMPFENLGLIGYSLGAHVAGLAGKKVKYGKVDFIIGLDTASPLFDYHHKAGRLYKTDANFVESIQTSALMGFYLPIGRSSFFINGGITQPGCGLDLLRYCAHARSYIYYSEALRLNSFRGIKCKTRRSALSRCDKSWSVERMGFPKTYESEGIFHVPVNCKPPYGTG